MNDELPLYDYEAEKGALGAMILSNIALAEVASILTEADFFRPSHRLMFRALTRLEAAGLPTDYLTIKAELEEMGVLAQVGGEDFIIAVAEFVPSAECSGAYARIVSEKARRRSIHTNAQRIVSASTNPDVTPAELAAMIETAGLEAAPKIAPAYRLPEIDHETTAPLGVSTGHDRLDGLIDTRGYPRGDVSVISAYHKGGKTAFAIGSACHAAREGLNVVYATFADMGRIPLARRFYRQICGWSQPSDRMTESQFAAYERAKEEVKSWRLRVYDAAAQDEGFEIETFLAWLHAANMRRPIDLAIIDYAQELSTRKKVKSVYENDMACAQAINRWSRRHPETAVAVLSQITEGGKGERDRTKGGRHWEEKAGWVLRLAEADEETHDRTVEVAFSRYGAMNRKLPFSWDAYRIAYRQGYKLSADEDDD